MREREREKDAYVQSERMCGRVRERKKEIERKRKEKETHRGTTEE